MGGQKSKSTIPKLTVSAATSRTTTSDATQPRRRMVQNYLVIWVDGNIDENTEDCRNTLAQLRAAYATSGYHLYFCDNEARYEPWAKDWPKIQGVFTSIEPICGSLKKVARECDHDSIPKRCTSDAASNEQNVNQLPPNYMYSVIFKDIVLEINDDDAKSIKALEIYCKKQNIPDAEINELKSKYHQKSPIWWYTREIFLYGMLDCGLHLQLKQLHQQQSANFKKSFTVYRGQGMTKEDFQNLLDSKGGLLSFSNFLSTSMEQKVGMEFVERTMKKNKDIVGVIFIMTIDQSKLSTSNTPFAMIDEHSAIPSEKEILFAMHTVFRVVEIKQTAKNNRLWEVHLTITDDNDPQLSTLTNCIKEEIRGSTGWHRMGQLMIKVGHFDLAEELYQELLKNASTDSDGAHIYHQLGYLKDQQEDDASLAPTYGAIGLVYDSMGEYSKALEFYEKALKIKEISLPPTHPDLATSYNNTTTAYYGMDQYSKAFSYLEKALTIYQNSLPPTHHYIKEVMNDIDSVKKKL
ncbi:unnamed protein product [Rotaria magnacalcarata]|uniref:Uncharacterized protein n=1 Tax=Rotaria magnacalcarata TaxID=392030 RepID=A0A816TJ80_9BILA|nr:unnamed protein product [Rotaria magnacalcarata]